MRRPGALVGVEVTIKGYRDQALPLRWYLLDGPEIVDQQSRRHTLTADRNEAPAAWSFWAPIPPGAGPFKIVVQIFPPNAKPGRRPRSTRRRRSRSVRRLAERAQLEGQHEQARELAADEVRRPAAVG